MNKLHERYKFEVERDPSGIERYQGMIDRASSMPRPWPLEVARMVPGPTLNHAELAHKIIVTIEQLTKLKENGPTSNEETAR
jgi:hypothetical protein